MNQAISQDQRDIGAFIPSFLDDYGLDPFEFRIYAHIARRAGSGVCFEGLNGIARCCHMDIKTVRWKLAVLEDAGMIQCQAKIGKPYDIILTKQSRWVHPELLPDIRLKRTPTTTGRGTKSGSTDKGTPTKSGRTPLPQQVGLPLPQQVPEGIPFKEIQIKEIQIKEKDSLSVSAKTDDREKEKKPKVKTLPNRNAEPKEVYASLKNLEGFEKFWGWYDGNCRSHPKRDGSIPAKGSKKFAAIAWRDITEHLSPEQYQEFRQGCLDFNWNINGVPHAENFIKHEHWKKAIAGEKEFLEDLQGSKESDPQGNINLAPRYSPQNEQKSVSGTIHHPEWLETPERSYIDWLASSYLSRRPEFRDNPPTIAIARTWLMKAKHDSLRFSEAASTWESYLEEKAIAEKRNAKNADWLIPPVDPSKIDHAAVQEGMLRARRIMEQAGIRIGVPNAS